MPNFASITLAGHLGRDAELKQVGDTTVLEWSMAVTEKSRKGDSTAWYRCALWGKRGESLAQYLTKGTAVIVSGALVPREYKGKNEELRTSLDVRVDQFSFAGGGGGKSESDASNDHTPAPADDDIPF